MNIFKSIKEFNELAGNTTDRFNARQSALYMGLQCEELAEKIVAVFGKCEGAERLDLLATNLKIGAFDDLFTPGACAEMLDADCDLIVVSIGAALSQGADIKGAMKEVCRSNDSKLALVRLADGSGHRYELQKDANGKIIKGPNFTPPNLAPYFAK